MPVFSSILLCHQAFHLVQQLAEELQSVVHGGGTGHIHTGALQQVDGALGAAAGQEAQIVLHSVLPFPQNAAGQGNGSRIAGGVLENIVIIVEVGNSGPLHGDLIVHHHVLAVIQLAQPGILGAEHIGGQGLACVHGCAHELLELGKHGLAVDGALELVQEVVDQEDPLLLVGGLLQQILHEQGLVAGGGHLGHEDHIVGVDLVLVLVGQVGVQGVAHLVGQGELAVQGAGVVQQHKGMDLGACGVSAAPLALVLIDIDPAVLEALLQKSYSHYNTGSRDCLPKRTVQGKKIC